MGSSFQKRWQGFAAKWGLALFFFQCCGCAHLAVVKTKPAELPRTLVTERPLESAYGYLLSAEHEQPLPALGHDLLAAKISYGELERQPKDESARSIYNFAVARVVQDLDGIKRAFPDHKRVVLIGHSMGGMICRLMITDTGDKIWRDFFSTPPAKTPLASDTRKLLEEAVVFNHRPEVKRVIFISTPHRGSKLASGWIGRIGASF